MTPTVTMIGCGNMGGAVLLSWLDAGLATQCHFSVRLRDPAQYPSAAAYTERVAQHQLLYPGVPLCPDAATAFAADIIVLAVKPQVFRRRTWPAVNPHATVISLMAGISLREMQPRLPVRQIIRTMPNLGQRAGLGVTGLVTAGGPVADPLLTQLLTAGTRAWWLDTEPQLHHVIALSGSAPAYYFALADRLLARGEGSPESQLYALQQPQTSSLYDAIDHALLQLGTHWGYATDDLRPLIAQVRAGAAAYATTHLTKHPQNGFEHCWRSVMSPNGTTQAALGVLGLGPDATESPAGGALSRSLSERHTAVRAVMHAAALAAYDRSVTLEAGG